jgi:hypothetical protein
MRSFEWHRSPGTALLALLVSSAWSSGAEAQQSPQGFAVERFYPSAPGSGWLVMDDLDMDGTSGTLGPYQWNAPAVDVGTNPDSISDARVGFDARLLGDPGSSLRIGVGAQLIIPSGDRADYVTDGTYRGMFRLLAAGDVGRFAYAGQLGLHLRPVDESPAPGGPHGSEFLFGVSAGRRLSAGSGWLVVVGPEVYGETALRSFFGEETGVEGLLTGRFERIGNGPHLGVKVGVGRGLDPHFGAPEWRIVCGVELFGQRPAGGDGGRRRAAQD